MLESHFISPAAFDILLRDPFTPTDFEAFIAERQRTIQDAIESLLIKERLDLPPQLRELDKQIERVELRLRSLVASEISDDSKMPSRVIQKVEERISQAMRKNAAIDGEQYKSLDRKLEYADLRELQDVLTGKTLWAMFEPRFSNKESLNVKFSQLAELRNALRHSRTVDEVTRKEGEAAVLWFKQVLDKEPAAA